MDDISIRKLLKQVPEADLILESASLKYYFDLYTEEKVLNTTKIVIGDLKESIKKGQINSINEEKIINKIINKLNSEVKTTLSPVINATGIILHKDIGRAPLSKEIINSLTSKFIGYCNLDFDINKGRELNRSEHLNSILNLFTGGEKSLVVNNNTAALLLIFNTFAKDKEILLSNAEDTLIDNETKLSDLINQAGCKPIIIKNITNNNLNGYMTYITPESKMIMKNQTLDINELEAFKTDLPAKNEDIIKIINHINGNLLNLKCFGLPNSPSPKMLIDCGFDLVTFTGDKLLGGPEAGIITGKENLINQLIENPLYKSIKPNKLTLIALEATLLLYLNQSEALENIPALKMLTRPINEIEFDAKIIYEDLKNINSIECGIKKHFSEAGEDPEKLIVLATYQVWLKHKTIPADQLYKIFLENFVLTIIKNDKIIIDPRCLNENDIKKLCMIFSMVLK